MKHIVALLIVPPFTAALFYWYGHLWFPRLGITYWSQAFPVAFATVAALMLCGESPAAKLIASILGTVCIVSIIVQTLVWVSVIPHPNF